MFYTYLPFRENDIRKDVPRELTDHPTIDHMSFDRISMSVNFLKERTKCRPKISIICGTGLGMLSQHCRLLNLYYGIGYLFICCEIYNSNEIFHILQ